MGQSPIAATPGLAGSLPRGSSDPSPMEHRGRGSPFCWRHASYPCMLAKTMVTETTRAKTAIKHCFFQLLCVWRRVHPSRTGSDMCFPPPCPPHALCLLSLPPCSSLTFSSFPCTSLPSLSLAIPACLSAPRPHVRPPLSKLVPDMVHALNEPRPLFRPGPELAV